MGRMVKRKAKRAVKKLKIEKKKRIAKGPLTLLIIVVALLILAIVLMASSLFILPEKEKIDEKIYTVHRFLSIGNATLTSMHLPAVDNNGSGVLTTLVVEASPGSGRTLVDIDNLLFWADTQNSIRTARSVAGNITGVDLSEYDLIYNIYANASIIGGPSAGAAITIATIAALENKTLREDVMITGSVNHDGTIGPVSSILAKAKAAKDINASIFLVPLLQSREVTYETKKYCEKIGWTEFCTIEQIPRKVKISDEAGIKVEEVGSVKEALDYFLE